MIQKGKVQSYLLYAIGEILLVVIGILIALQINNWNERLNAEEEIAAIMDQIYTELSVDVDYQKDLEAHFIRSDSILTLVRGGNVTREMYLKYPALRKAIFDIQRAWVKEHGYKLLMSRGDQIPAKYDILVLHLDKLYDLWPYEFAWSAERRTNLWEHVVLDWAKNQPWYSLEELTEPEIEYYLNDPTYANYMKIVQARRREALQEIQNFLREAEVILKIMEDLKGKAE